MAVTADSAHSESRVLPSQSSSTVHLSIKMHSAIAAIRILVSAFFCVTRRTANVFRDEPIENLATCWTVSNWRKRKLMVNIWALSGVHVFIPVAVQYWSTYFETGFVQQRYAS